MTTRADDGPDFDAGPGGDDPLAVILRPPSAHLGPPPGHFEAVRRAAGRRRLLRAAAGAGVSCAVAVLVALPFHLAGPTTPAPPSVPLAPPPVSGPATPLATPGDPTPSPSSATPTRSMPSGPVSPRPTAGSGSAGPRMPEPSDTRTRRPGPISSRPSAEASTSPHRSG
ncbi:hypothetical protein AB0C59_21760 [Streptomyces sp. NPDC048664]|uniref:hypothetical protein n=1 Tax=Streptomyces sp. NPDC048664 TaxID=3154505 RepID=UPI00343B2E92